MKSYFKVPLTSKAEVEGFFWNLFSDNLLFHPEDDPKNIVRVSELNLKRSEPLFTADEIVQLRARLDEVWDIYDDPCKFILDTFYTKPDYEDQVHTAFYNENL